jgi:hypothetical protein
LGEEGLRCFLDGGEACQVTFEIGDFDARRGLVDFANELVCTGGVAAGEEDVGGIFSGDEGD